MNRPLESRPHQSAHDRYRTDPAYRQLVDMMWLCMERAEFTPSEIREASILASIRYEQFRIREFTVALTPELHRQMTDFENIVHGAARDGENFRDR